MHVYVCLLCSTFCAFENTNMAYGFKQVQLKLLLLLLLLLLLNCHL